MSTSKTYQQSLADAGSETIPMIERGSYIPWGDALLHYDAEIKVMNLILLSIRNDIYNFVDACSLANDMWKRVKLDTFDDLFDYLPQFEKMVNTLRVKKLEKSHDPLALVAHTGLSSRNTSSYYVTHPKSVVDYDNEYQQDDIQTNPEDPLASAMLLLARAITQNFTNPTNNHLRTSSNTRNQAIIQGDGDEAVVILMDKQNDFLFADASSTIGDDQIDSNIIFYTPNRNVDSGSVEKHTHVPDLYALEQLTRNAYQEKQQIFAQKVQKQNTTLTSQLELYKKMARVLENINEDNNYLNKFLKDDQRAKHFDQQAQS
nr:hypothetical protein [Tanacetum cinerariifolium]